MIKLNRLIDKTALLIFGTAISLFLDIPTSILILCFLLSIIVLSLSQCITGKIPFFILHGIFAASCLFIPANFMFYPVGLYDVLYSNKKYAKLIFILLPILSFLVCPVKNSILIVVISFVTILLSLRSSECSHIKREFISLRDTSAENQLLLLERNRYLTKSKDDEINLAVMSERNRIAREIHDNVGHMLSRTILQMGAVRILNTDENIKPHLEEINNSINGAMTSMRESVHNLHDNTLSLRNTVNEIIKPLSEKFTVKFDIDISEKTSHDLKLCIIGITKEAVSNVMKHSNGDKVTIFLREHPAFYQIIIEDNGINNCIIPESGMGMGIENMKLRTENENGIFKVTSNEKCFKIFASIPKRKDKLT